MTAVQQVETSVGENQRAWKRRYETGDLSVGWRMPVVGQDVTGQCRWFGYFRAVNPWRSSLDVFEHLDDVGHATYSLRFLYSSVGFGAGDES